MSRKYLLSYSRGSTFSKFSSRTGASFPIIIILCIITVWVAKNSVKLYLAEQCLRLIKALVISLQKLSFVENVYISNASYELLWLTLYNSYRDITTNFLVNNNFKYSKFVSFSDNLEYSRRKKNLRRQPRWRPLVYPCT